MTRRGRLIGGGIVVVVAAIVVLVVASANSATANCGFPPPAPVLPPALLAIGSFSNPTDSSAQSLDLLAGEAETALYPGTPGTAGQPVAVASASPNHPGALIVPIMGSASRSGGGVIATVVFLTDCSGRAFYDTTHSYGSHPLPQFPAVTQSAAAAQLGGSVILVYSSDPAQPLWRNPMTGRTIPAV